MASTIADMMAYYSRVLFVTYCSIMPILFVMGIIGAILSGIIFSHKSMRQNPGSIYFIAQSVIIFMTMVLCVLPLLYKVIANVTISPQSISYCKLLIYTTNLCPVIHRYCLILAAIDRTLITSSNATVRKRSTHRLAYWTISGMTLIAILYHIHTLVGYVIYVLPSGITICAPSIGTYSYFFAYSGLVVSNLIPLTLLSILAIKTLRNLQRVRIQPTTTDPIVSNTHRSKDRQLTILLLADILIIVFLQLFVTGLNMYINITSNQVKSPSQQLLESFLQNMSTIFLYTPLAISFYQNLLISKGFRRKAKEVLFSRFCQHSNGITNHRNV